MEEVAAAVTRPFWFQLYVMKDRAYAEDLVERAKVVGCTTLVLTVDLAVIGRRYRDDRNGLGGASRRSVNFDGGRLRAPSVMDA